ncbi:MAG: hypothetical protein M1822_009550 [Bathelium mastoideum]|nr:MAG: hypothetical protein M1822_009550 [Bathelium mastoideum]
MAEPLGLATAIGSLISYAYKISKTTYEAIDGIRKAPKHLSFISDDLKVFYSNLGTLYGYLSEDDTATGVLHPAVSLELKDVLRNCIAIVEELKAFINEYTKDEATGSAAKWHYAQWPWKEKEVTRLREHFSTNKMTLSCVISSINL